MNKFVLVKDLKKEPNIKSFDVIFSSHCPLDLIIEEVILLGNLNLLTIGVSECNFYSKKQKIGKNLINWSYEITDSEIIFGDYKDLDKTFSLLEKSNKKTVVVMTCIPCIINLDIDKYLKNDKFIFVKAPHYKGISSVDYLNDLYLQIFKNINVKKTKKYSYFYGNLKYKEIVEKLNSNCYILNDYIYFDLLNYFSSKYDIKLIDNTIFHDISFYYDNYQILNINLNKIKEIEKIIKKIDKNKKISIKGYYSYLLANFLENNGFKIDSVYFLEYNYFSYINLKKLNEKIKVYFDYHRTKNDFEINLSKYDEEVFNLKGFDLLYFYMKKMEEMLC